MTELDTRIVVTGVGLATVFGVGREATWRGVIEGRCGLADRPVLRVDEDEGVGGAGAASEGGRLREVVREAIAEAGLGGAPTRRRVGVVMGTTLHGIRGAGRFLRTGDAGQLASVPAARVLRDAIDGLGVDGPRLTTCSACSSGLGAVAMGVTLLGAGVLDVAIVGGYDPEAEYAAAGFASLRLVASGLPRPFCRGRDGLRIGEGYAALVLERASEARARGGVALAEILGWGESGDAFHLTRPHPAGTGAALAMKEALGRAGLDARGVDMIGAHATGTPANDAAEFQAMRSVLGERLGSIPVVAFKGHVGHTLGAAGAVELVLSLLALREGIVPPTPNIAPGDLEFEGLDLVTSGARRKVLRTTMSLSAGFGGANACVVLGAPGGGERTAPRPETEVAITGIGLLVPGAIGSERVLMLLRDAGMGRGRVRGGSIGADEIAPIVAAYRLRRQSEYSTLTIGAAALALAHAGVAERSAFTADCGAILGTAHGSAGYSEAYYREIVERGPEAGNPMLFAEGVPNAGAAQLSITLGITGGCQTIVGSRTAGLEALALAAVRIRCGDWRRAVVGGAEEFNGVVNAGYEACGLTGRSGGFLPGSGAGAFVLESLADARARGARVLATLGSAGLAFSRGRSASEMGASIAEALADADADGLVVGSGNGTWIGELEGNVVRRMLGRDRYEPTGNWLPEMFAAGPLVGLGAAVLREREAEPGSGSRRRVTGLCVDPIGPVAAVSVRPT